MLRSCNSSDGGKYEVCVENASGRDVAVTSINVLDAPGPVESPTFENVFDSKLTLKWKLPPHDGGSTVTSYTVERYCSQFIMFLLLILI